MASRFRLHSAVVLLLAFASAAVAEDFAAAAKREEERRKKARAEQEAGTGTTDELAALRRNAFTEVDANTAAAVHSAPKKPAVQPTPRPSASPGTATTRTATAPTNTGAGVNVARPVCTTGAIVTAGKSAIQLRDEARNAPTTVCTTAQSGPYAPYNVK